MTAIIIEDDPEVVELVNLTFDLRWPEERVLFASSGVQGLNLIEKEKPDLVILDIGLPDIDGFEVCRRIRLFSDVPVVMLTARQSELDKVKGLELGADDFVTKPFSHAELLARVQAVIRRSTTPRNEEDEVPLTVGRVWIDFKSRKVRVDGEEVRLTPTESKLLRVLARNVGRMIPHRIILEKVWGYNYADSTDCLKVYVQRLRSKLKDDSKNPQLIVCERGVGYMLVKQAEALLV